MTVNTNGSNLFGFKLVAHYKEAVLFPESAFSTSLSTSQLLWQRAEHLMVWSVQTFSLKKANNGMWRVIKVQQRSVFCC
jgi:hypothetical protein